MFKDINNITFEKIYFFIVFLFAAQSTYLTWQPDPRLNPIGFLLLGIPTLMICRKYRLSLLDKRLVYIYIISLGWIFLQYICTMNYKVFMTVPLILQFIIAYVVVRIYKLNLFRYFEKIVVALTLIDIILWGIMQIVGVNVMASLGFMKPASAISQASMLIFNIPQINEENVLFGLTRNCGFCWEPGRFASFLIFAIFFNLARTRRIKSNTNLFILLIGLFTSLSTTGYSVFILIALNYFFFQKSKSSYRVSALLIGIPLFFWIMSLSFMSSKIEATMNAENYLSENTYSLDYFENNEKQMVVQRFEGLYLDFLNFIHAPILGCGIREESYISTEISPYLATSNGLMSLLGTYGIIIGFLFIYMFYKSAKYFDSIHKQRYCMLIFVFFSISISYSFNFIALFIAIMWYRYFISIKNLKAQTI